MLDAKIPAGPLADKWDTFIADAKLVNPNNKRKFKILVVGTGLAGASAAATLAELGYQVEAFTFHDSARRAHSIAAQGGINAAKNYRGDGDSIYRLFYDTIKGGDFRAREGNVYRLAQVSVDIIDQCVAQGVPFAREYGGLLDNRSFGGAQVSRTFYVGGQTGQQLLLGAYQQMSRQVGLGNVKLWNRVELVDVVVIDGRCAGIVTRDLLTGEFRSHAGHAVVLCTGGYGNVFFLSTNAMACNVTAAWRAHRRGAYFANPCYTQIHPTCIPQSDEFQSKLTLMSESLRNDGRVWVPDDPDDTRPPAAIPEGERDYYLERLYPSFGNLAPRDISSRAAKRAVDSGRGVGPRKNGVYLDFAEAIGRLGTDVVAAALREPVRDVRADHRRGSVHRPDADLPGVALHDGRALGRLRADDHRAGPVLRRRGQLLRPRRQPPRRVGPHAGPRRRVLRAAHTRWATTSPRCSTSRSPAPTTTSSPPPRPRPEPASSATSRSRAPARPTTSTASSAGSCGTTAGWSARRPVWRRRCRTSRRCTTSSNTTCASPGRRQTVNQTLEKAGRVDDFFQLAMLMCRDALEREESCGGHFRAEHQTEEGEARRDDEGLAHVAAWEWTGDPTEARRHEEELVYETVHFQTRSYK